MTELKVRSYDHFKGCFLDDGLREYALILYASSQLLIAHRKSVETLLWLAVPRFRQKVSLALALLS